MGSLVRRQPVDRLAVELHAAAVILQRAMERYREKNQGDVLQQASRWFAELTLGSFSGLRGDCNERGEPVLVGVRGEGRTLVGVDSMSDGTRDQLYLALRLANDLDLENIRQHLTEIAFNGEPGKRFDIADLQRGIITILPKMKPVTGI